MVKVLTPDREVVTMRVAGDELAGLFRWPGGPRSPGVATKQIYEAKHSSTGEFTFEELEKFYDKYDVRRRVPQKSAPPEALGGAPAPPALGGLGVGLPTGAGGTVVTAAGLGAGANNLWLVVSGDENHEVGTEAEPPIGAALVGHFAVADTGGSMPLVLRKVPVLNVDLVRRERWLAVKKEFATEVQELTEKAPAGGQGGLSAFKAADEELELEVEKAPPNSKEVDCRLLPVAVDESGERWRTIPDALPLMHQQEFDDWPLDSVRSTRYLMRELRRASKTFLTSHSDWVKNSGVRATDRAVHEHRALSKALELAVSYDQLAVVNLASVKCLVKRRMLIEAAYEASPEAPRWDGAEHFMGYRDTDNGVFVDPQAMKHRAQRMKQEMEVMREYRLKREEDSAARGKGNKGDRGGAAGGPKGGGQPKEEPG